MAAVSELSVLLFALISNIHAEELIVIRGERSSLTFELPEEAGSCLISRCVGEEKLVLWNTSTVCGSIDRTRGESMKDEETKDLPCPGAADHLDVQWLKRDYRYEQKIWTRVFGDDTASVMDNDRGRYQVVKNTSALRISTISTADLGEYTCLLMNQQQCVRSDPVKYEMVIRNSYHSVEDTAVLQCPVSGFNEDKPPYWKTKYKNIHQGQHNLSVGVVDQNYSLVLTLVTLNHSGLYSCKTLTTVKTYQLWVCPKSPPPAVELYSGGEEVTLRCKDWEKGRGHLWFFKSNRTKGRTISLRYRQFRSNVRRYLDGRFVISNVSLEDTGEYWCGVLDRNDQCMFSTKTLLKHRDPFGVHSTF